MVFVLVAGLSSGALAIGSSIAVTSVRHSAFRDRARAEVLDDIRPLAEGSSPLDIARRLQNVEQPGGPGVVVDTEEGVVSSVERLDLGDVPADLRRAVGALEDEELAERSASVGGEPYFIVGASPPDVDAELYFFFPQDDLLRGLTELRNGLAFGWLAVVAVAGFIGDVVARRTLRPVRTAAAAAQSVTEGLLETRLPVEGDDEFGRLATSFNEMVAALEDKLEAVATARDRERRFNADVAHELRTPLGTLVTAASMFDGRSGDLPPDLRRAAELMVDGARRLHRLVDELLELHRLEAGHEDPVLDVVDLVEAVEASVRAHGWEDDVTRHASGPAPVAVDRLRLERILVNLLANALEHGGTDVQARVTTVDGHAVLAVSDRGPGIPADQLPHLFDRYYKVSQSRAAPAVARRSSGGSGLGLAIAAENARVLGGRITVASETGAGATFRLELPLNSSP